MRKGGKEVTFSFRHEMSPTVFTVKLQLHCAHTHTHTHVSAAKYVNYVFLVSLRVLADVTKMTSCGCCHGSKSLGPDAKNGIIFILVVMTQKSSRRVRGWFHFSPHWIHL